MWRIYTKSQYCGKKVGMIVKSLQVDASLWIDCERYDVYWLYRITTLLQNLYVYI